MRRGGMGPGGMMGGMPAAKSKDFRASLRPAPATAAAGEPPAHPVRLRAGVISVAFAVLGPKILGNATNLIFEGVISKQLPVGVTKEQVVAALRAKGQDQLADMLASMNLTPGQGVDFGALGGHPRSC